MSVVECLAEQRDFTRAERELADYLLHHADEATHLGMRELAAAAGKSNGTIMSLCRKAGSSGWRAFRIDLASDIERLRRRTVRVNPNEPFRGAVSPQAALNSIAALKREALEDCYATVSPAAVKALADALVAAERVIFYARGDSYATALAFGALVSKIGVDCAPADLYRFGNERAFHATERDLALFVTYSGEMLDRSTTQLETLRNRRCKIAVVTSLVSAVGRFSGFDYPVVVPHRENKFGKVATFYSQTCLRYVLDCAYSLAFSQNYASNLRNKDLIEMLEPGLAE